MIKRTEQMKNQKTVKNESAMPKNKRVIIILTAVFLGLVLLFGIVLGTIAIIRNVRAVMIYKGTIIDRGVANYLAMMGKYSFMTGLAARGIENSDDESFWSKISADGRTYGELLKEETELYMKKVLVGSYLFDRNATLTAIDEANINNAVEAVLYNFGGEDKLNKEAEKLGFDYSDIRKASEMIYKYLVAKDVIFGYDASTLKSGAFNAQCDEFFSTYTHAKLLFIRTEDKLVTNPDTGEVTSEALSDNEKADINSEIERIRYLISGDGDESMSKEEFVRRITLWSEKDSMNIVGGYYLAPTSEDTAKLREIYPEVVNAVYSLEMGEYAEVKTRWGVCFIYRDEPTAAAYALPSMDRFFTDFYTDAATYIYAEELTALSGDVKVKKKFYDIDIIALPYNFRLVVKV